MTAEVPSVTFLASGSGSVLDGVIGHFVDDPRVHLSAVVVDRAERGAATVAARHGLPAPVVDRRDAADRVDYSARLADVLTDLGTDWVLMTFDHILEPVLLDRFPNRVLNVHYSLLPAFIGLEPIPKVLAAGTRFAGATIHLAHAEVDAGPPVVQAVVPVGVDDDVAGLQHRLFGLMSIMARQTVEWIAAGALETSATAVTIRDARRGIEINPHPTAFEADLTAWRQEHASP